MTSLAIIAGKGNLPIDVALAAASMGFNVVVFPIQGQADADFVGYQTVPIHLGSIRKTRSAITQRRIKKLIMVGKVVWPSMATLQPDLDGIKLLGKMITRGDDSVLRALACYFAEKDIEVVGPECFLPNRKMPLGFVAGDKNIVEKVLNCRNEINIKYALSVLDALGSHDVGQSIIVQNGRVIAIEAAEGTDAMIARSEALLDPTNGISCFVKIAKKAQDLRLDIPVFGCETIHKAANVGLSLLAIESQRVLLADDLAMIKSHCEIHSISLIGIHRQGVS